MEIFGLFLAGLSSLIFAYILGLLTLQFFNIDLRNKIGNNFIPVVIGVFMITVLFSIIKTKFNSVNTTVFLLVSIYILISKRNISLKHISLKLKLLPKKILYFLFIYLFIFGYFSLLYYDFTLLEMKYPWYDTCFYSDLSRGISKTYFENTSSVFYQFKNINNIEVYHYFDLWINIIFNKIFGYNFYYSICLLTYPFLCSIFFIGLIDLFKFQVIKNKLLLILFVLIPFSINLPFMEDYNFFNNYGLNLNISIITNYKILINYILILLFIYCIEYKKSIEGTLVLLICSAIYSTTLISILPTLSTLIFLGIIFRKKLNINIYELKKQVILLLSFIVILLSILYFNTSSQINEIKNEYTFNLPEFKTQIIVFIEYFIKYSLNYLPVIIILLFTIILLKKQNKNTQLKKLYLLSIIVTLILLFSITFSSIFHGVDLNYPQSISNIMVCCFTALMIYSVFIIVKLNFNHKNKILIVIFALGLLNFKLSLNKNYNMNYDINYSSDYKKNVIKTINRYKNSKYITISKSFDSNRKFDDFKFNQMDAFSTNCENISMGYDLSNVLYRKDKDLFLENFIKEYSVTHLFISKNVSINLETKSILTDENTEERFITLPNKK
jgi:hypothetical protein